MIIETSSVERDPVTCRASYLDRHTISTMKGPLSLAASPGTLYRAYKKTRVACPCSPRHRDLPSTHPGTGVQHLQLQARGRIFNSAPSRPLGCGAVRHFVEHGVGITARTIRAAASCHARQRSSRPQNRERREPLALAADLVQYSGEGGGSVPTIVRAREQSTMSWD